jgi:hypothetical protein
MDDRKRFEASAASADAALERLALVPPPLRATRELFIDEVFRSTALAGASLSRSEVQALLDRDAVAPGSSLAENVLAPAAFAARHRRDRGPAFARRAPDARLAPRPLA